MFVSFILFIPSRLVTIIFSRLKEPIHYERVVLFLPGSNSRGRSIVRTRVGMISHMRLGPPSFAILMALSHVLVENASQTRFIYGPKYMCTAFASSEA